MVAGIYTLANDVVCDQLIALLNSIEMHAGKEVPVCVIAYDNQLEKVRLAIQDRKNVTLLDDPALFSVWEDFSKKVWETHPTALKMWQEQGISGVRRLGMNRRYCAFDPSAPFDRFVYLDADTLLMNSLDRVFEALNNYDVVVYDFQYKDPSHIYNVNSSKLFEVFDQTRINSEIFCAGFYASKRGLLQAETRDWLIAQLQAGEAEILYPSAPNQSVLNYLIMKSNLSVCNLALQLPPGTATGCSVTSPHFEYRDNILYDRGHQLTYIHYIGISSKIFSRVCSGENIDFPYRDVFLHYRYLSDPENCPQFTSKPTLYNAPPTLKQRIFRRLGLTR